MSGFSNTCASSNALRTVAVPPAARHKRPLGAPRGPPVAGPDQAAVALLLLFGQSFARCGWPPDYVEPDERIQAGAGATLASPCGCRSKRSGAPCYRYTIVVRGRGRPVPGGHCRHRPTRPHSLNQPPDPTDDRAYGGRIRIARLHRPSMVGHGLQWARLTPISTLRAGQ